MKRVQIKLYIPSIIICVIIFISCNSSTDIEIIPESATLLSPEKDKLCEVAEPSGSQKRKVTFKWSNGENTDYNELHIKNLETNRDTIINRIFSPLNTVDLYSATAYEWYVISYTNSTNEGVTTAPWRFYLQGNGVTNSVPHPATIITPDEGASVALNQENNTTLKWAGNDIDNSSDELKFTLFIDKIDGKQTPLAIYENITTTEVTLTLDEDTLYFWSIKTSDGESASFTRVYSFRTS